MKPTNEENLRQASLGDADAKAVKLIREQAEAGSSQGLYLLAMLHKNGNRVIRSFTRYCELLDKAASQGYAPAQYELAQVLLSDGIPLHNDARGVALLRKSMNQGYAKAEDFMAYLYLVGRGVEKDENKAFAMFSEATEAGCPEAMRSLGFCYMNGQGVEADRDRAAYWFSRALEAGLTDCAELVDVAKGGLDGMKEELKGESTRAVFEYRDRVIADAAKGNADANFELGRFYLNGMVTEWMPFDKDISMARKHFMLAAEAGHPEAAYTMGYLDENGYGIAQPDLSTAMKWYNMAAEKGHVNSMVELGRMYQQILCNYDEAIHWLQKASDAGNARAKGLLCAHYTYGEGVSRDEKLGFTLALESAESSDMQGQKMLGVYYLYGNGVNPDLEKAAWWLTASANQGEVYSMTFMGRLLMGDFGYTHTDYELAEQLLSAATHGGVAYAAYYLGMLYYNITNNQEKAHEAFRQAAELGNEDAMSFLTEHFS